MICVDPHKNASKKELQLRAELARYKKLESNCWKTWRKTGVENAFKWSAKAHEILVAIRAQELRNVVLCKELKIDKSFISTFFKVHKIK